MNSSSQDSNQLDSSSDKLRLPQLINEAIDSDKNQNQLSNLQKKIIQLEQQVRDLKIQNKHWQDRYNGVLNRNPDLGQQSDNLDPPELQLKIKKLLEKYDQKQQLLREKEQKITILEESMQKQKQEFDEELQQMIQQNEILLKKYDKLSKAFVINKFLLKDSTKQQQKLRKRIEKFQCIFELVKETVQLFLKLRQDRDNSIDKNNNPTQTAQLLQSNLDFSIQIDQERNLKYRGVNDDYRQLETEINLNKQILLKCKRQNVELQKSNAQYQRQFEQMDVVKLEMEGKLQHQEQKLLQNQEYLRKMEKEYGQDRQQVQQLNQQIKLLQNLNEELQIAYEQEQMVSQNLNQQLSKLTLNVQQLQNLELQYVDLQGEFQQLQYDYDQKCYHNTRMFQNVQELEAQNQEYCDKMDVLEKQCDEIKQLISPIEYQKNDLKNKNIELMRQIEQNYSDKQSLEYKIRDLSQKNVEAVNSMKVALEEKEFYKTNYQSLQLKVDSIQKKFDAEKLSISFSESQVVQKDQQLKIENESLKQKVDHLQSILEQKQKDIEQWRQNSNDIENQLKNERVKFQQQIDDLKQKNTNQGLKRLKDDSQEMKKYIDTKYQLELIQTENEKLNQVNDLLNQQNQQFIEELNELRPQYIKLTEDLRYINEKFCSEKDQHQFSVAQNYNLKIEFDSLNEKYFDLQNTFQAKYSDLQQQLDMLTQYNKNLETHLEKVNHQYQKYDN